MSTAVATVCRVIEAGPMRSLLRHIRFWLRSTELYPTLKKLPDTVAIHVGKRQGSVNIPCVRLHIIGHVYKSTQVPKAMLFFSAKEHILGTLICPLVTDL